MAVNVALIANSSRAGIVPGATAADGAVPAAAATIAAIPAAATDGGGIPAAAATVAVVRVALDSDAIADAASSEAVFRDATVVPEEIPKRKWWYWRCSYSSRSGVLRRAYQGERPTGLVSK